MFPRRKWPFGPGGYGSPFLFLSAPNKPYRMGTAERTARKVRACPGWLDRLSNMIKTTRNEHWALNHLCTCFKNNSHPETISLSLQVCETWTTSHQDINYYCIHLDSDVHTNLKRGAQFQSSVRRSVLGRHRLMINAARIKFRGAKVNRTKQGGGNATLKLL